MITGMNDNEERLIRSLRAIQKQANASAYWSIATMAGKAIAGEEVEYSEKIKEANDSSARAMVSGRW